MWACTGMGRLVQWRAVAILVFIVALVIAPALAEENSSFGQRLILNVYLDDSGKALVTGYADNLSGLSFLNSSQYRYENETNQLYALTDGLTTKAGDLWTIRFDANGSYDDYHVTFYLPSDMRLGKINTSSGLGYLLSASNESLVADVQGYVVHSPQYHHRLSAISGGKSQFNSSSTARGYRQYRQSQSDPGRICTNNSDPGGVHLHPEAQG